MAYEVLRNQYYVSGIFQFGVPLGFNLRYDSTTGDYELKQLPLIDGTEIGVGLAIPYKNGSWTSDALRDPKLFEDGDQTKPTALAQELSVKMKQIVYQAYKDKGGAAGKNVVNASARPEHQNDPLAVNDNFPGTGPGIGQSTSISGITSAIASFAGLEGFLNPLDNIQSINEKFDTKGDDILSKFNILKYPSDILEQHQDTLHIVQFRYQPPRADIFKNPGDVISNGFKRSSVLKKPLNTVILPIPNNAADGNSVSWGPDNMNNLTAAATGAVVGNMKEYLGYALGGGLLGTLAGAGGQQGAQIALIAKLFQDLAGKAAGSQNAKVAGGTALGSKILNMAGFQVEAESILARAGGIVPNSNLELLFGGPSLREFNFTYRMSPRSSGEAREIKQIIRSFKQGMAARKIEGKAGSPSYYLSTPNVFKLTYKTGNSAISGMNKFKICALTGFTVNYVPDGQWAAYEGGQPVSYLVSMNFQELEPLYETDYRDDVDDELLKNGDQDPVGLEDIGY
jgi:hypothetical protein